MRHYSIKRSFCIILNDETEVDSVTKEVANHGLCSLYKIGVYGSERQHELFVMGSWWKRRKFLKEWSAKSKK